MGVGVVGRVAVGSARALVSRLDGDPDGGPAGSAPAGPGSGPVGDEGDEGDEGANDEGSGGLKAQVKEATTRLERELIVKALQQTGNNVTQAARLLKISRKSLQIKMKELGLRENS